MSLLNKIQSAEVRAEMRGFMFLLLKELSMIEAKYDKLIEDTKEDKAQLVC